MSNILLIDEHPETKNLLMKCLETAGFEVIITESCCAIDSEST